MLSVRYLVPVLHDQVDQLAGWAGWLRPALARLCLRLPLLQALQVSLLSIFISFCPNTSIYLYIRLSIFQAFTYILHIYQFWNINFRLSFCILQALQVSRLSFFFSFCSINLSASLYLSSIHMSAIYQSSVIFSFCPNVSIYSRSAGQLSYLP